MLATVLTVAGQTPADVSGEWAVTGETDAGSFASSFVLEQNGTELTGHYSSELLGEAELKGSVSGNDVTFSFSASAQGYDFDVTYTCTLQDDGTLSGQIDVGGARRRDYHRQATLTRAGMSRGGDGERDAGRPETCLAAGMDDYITKP